MESQAAVAVEVMDKKEALNLINGFVTADEKWLAFDKFLDAQVDKDKKIRRITIIKGLILESMGHEVKDYRNKIVKAVMRDLSGDDQRRVHKKFLSIKSLISQARNNVAPKSDKPVRKKRSTMTVFLPSESDKPVDLDTFEGLKALLMYRLDGLAPKEILEIEGIVRVKSEAVKDTERVTVPAA